jgi:hypothetical protein
LKRALIAADEAGQLGSEAGQSLVAGIGPLERDFQDLLSEVAFASLQQTFSAKGRPPPAAGRPPAARQLTVEFQAWEAQSFPLANTIACGLAVFEKRHVGLP